VQYDNLGRRILTINPELDSVAATYDAKNNMLTRVTTAKPGSPLFGDPLTESYLYDPQFNKVTRSTDPAGNVTNFAYDPSSLPGYTVPKANLLSITYPAVDFNGSSIRPVMSMTYNERGQVLTSTAPVSSFRYRPSQQSNSCEF
jgi:YD repeat-containing protein